MTHERDHQSTKFSIILWQVKWKFRKTYKKLRLWDLTSYNSESQTKCLLCGNEESISNHFSTTNSSDIFYSKLEFPNELAK